MGEEFKFVKEREFKFTHANFETVVNLINEFSGITLSDRKTDMVYSRLARRLRKLAINSFDDYLDYVVNDSDEQINFINSLTTNLTHFFRENHHFDYLIDEYLAELFKQNKKRIRFWSAGCSTGEEPYTLSMVWEEQPNKPNNIDFKILATDLDTNVLDTCKMGIYHNDKLKPVSDKYQKYFKKTAKCKATEKEINPNLKNNITFKQLNLMEEWPMSGPFDLIICRNVLIYFDKPTQEKLVKRFHGMLAENGCLMLGHSENLSANKNNFDALGKTIYRKI